MIFPATLVITTNTSQITSFISDVYHQLNHQHHQNDPDSFNLTDQTGWGIDQIRLLKKFLSQKPYSANNKIVVIHQAENLLTEAQNALLKILEEPGPDNYVVLITSKPSSLLTTIISRCHQINLTPKSTSIPIKLKPTGNIATDLHQADEFSAIKEEVLPFLENQLLAYQQQLVIQPSLQTSTTIKKLVKSISMIKAHVDPRSALDYFLLS